MKLFKALIATTAILSASVTLAQTINTGTKVTVAAGSAIIGKVGIDQTTPGTTNLVNAEGKIAHDAPYSTLKPVGTGCYAANTPPTAVAAADLVNKWCTPEGATMIGGRQVTGGDAGGTAYTFMAAGSGNYLPLAVGEHIFDGTNVIRSRSIVGAVTLGTGTIAFHKAPTSAAPAAIAPVVSAGLESCKVLKASPGNLYSLAVTIQATTVIVQVFDATSAPSDGAVTPIWAMPVISNGTLGGDSWSFETPLRGSVGLVACASSATTPFTKTASATAMFSGMAL